ncbi:enoyl-CoA hydratase-related protein [Sphingobium vermicomposti]|uniref:Crotonobetainyl-CoA hydratase n=1 Tax=Sphingobium vermicomposti TaxID=529005 RepID=A0A846M964_9SPHN|nr:enoyl-CoA hydratase-related protein [Sphingobium vermicomposti]NIJ17768.1 crotonobetainyl-CoA hydratase [Sphingobium vermicomposti]
MSYVEVSTDGAVTHIVLNRPASHNALTPDMHHDLEAAFNGFAQDPDAMIAVVTGAGDRAFCAGSDLKFDVLNMRYPDHGYAGLTQRFDMAKPVIAAVNGYALGGGFELALACDIIIATDTASFGLPEPLAGMVALGGGLHRLARQIGLKQAAGLILTSRVISATEGHRLGFVNEVVRPDDLQSAVASYCADILRASPAAIRASKQAMMRGLDEPSVAKALAHQASYPEFAEWRESADAREGPLAFSQKRPARWTS